MSIEHLRRYLLAQTDESNESSENTTQEILQTPTLTPEEKAKKIVEKGVEDVGHAPFYAYELEPDYVNNKTQEVITEPEAQAKIDEIRKNKINTSVIRDSDSGLPRPVADSIELLQTVFKNNNNYIISLVMKELELRYIPEIHELLKRKTFRQKQIDELLSLPIEFKPEVHAAIHTLRIRAVKIMKDRALSRIDVIKKIYGDIGVSDITRMFFTTSPMKNMPEEYMVGFVQRMKPRITREIMTNVYNQTIPQEINLVTNTKILDTDDENTINLKKLKLIYSDAESVLENLKTIHKEEKFTLDVALRYIAEYKNNTDGLDQNTYIQNLSTDVETLESIKNSFRDIHLNLLSLRVNVINKVANTVEYGLPFGRFNSHSLNPDKQPTERDRTLAISKKKELESKLRQFYTVEEVDPEELADELGYNFHSFPTAPSDYFITENLPFVTNGDTELNQKQIAANDKIREKNVFKKENINTLRQYCETAGLDNENNDFSLSVIKNGTNLNDMWQYVLHEFFSNPSLCNNNTSLFANAMQAAGIGELQKNIERFNSKNQYTFPLFDGYDISLRSKAEVQLLTSLRNKYRLSVIPSSMGVPKLSGCNVNKDGFQIDFVMNASLLKGYSDGHPVVQHETIFVGEYFGFNGVKPKVINAKDSEGIMGIDQKIAKIKRKINGTEQEVEALNGTEVTDGEYYSIKTKWKQMTEAFYAQFNGSSSLHFFDTTEKHMSLQLNNANILFNHEKCSIKTNSPTCSTAIAEIAEHLSHCPNCPLLLDKKNEIMFSNGQLIVATPDLEEAYLRAAETDLHVQYALSPAIVGYQNKSQSKITHDVYDWYESLRLIDEKISNTRNLLLQIKKTDPGSPEISLYLKQLEEFMREKENLHLKKLGGLKQEYDSIINQPEYKQKKKLLEDLHKLIRYKNGLIKSKIKKITLRNETEIIEMMKNIITEYKSDKYYYPKFLEIFNSKILISGQHLKSLVDTIIKPWIPKGTRA